MAKKQYPHKRSNIVINRAFQFKISLYFIFIAALCSITVLYILFSVQGHSITILYELLGEQLDSIQNSIHESRWLLILLSIAFFFFFSTILFFLGLYYSHRIIGPISRIHKHLGEFSKKLNAVPLIKLRKRDYLHHVKDIYNEMLCSVDNKNKLYIKHSKKVLPELKDIEAKIKSHNTDFSIREEIESLEEEIHKEVEDFT